MVTYYVALPFVRLENGGLAPGQAVECGSLPGSALDPQPLTA